MTFLKLLRKLGCRKAWALKSLRICVSFTHWKRVSATSKMTSKLFVINLMKPCNVNNISLFGDCEPRLFIGIQCEDFNLFTDYLARVKQDLKPAMFNYNWTSKAVDEYLDRRIQSTLKVNLLFCVAIFNTHCNYSQLFS